MILAALSTIAWADPPTERNLSATSVGLQYWTAPSLKPLRDAQLANGEAVEGVGDTDFLFSQRFRWTVLENDSLRVVARADGRFTVSPGDETVWKRNRVRKLGISIVSEKLTLDIGRHAVYRGGPRLIDGIQAVFQASPRVQVGAYAGLAPDLFTTDFRVRPAFGPILAYTSSRVQASVVGDVQLKDGLDRLGTLMQARVSAARTIDVAGRLDLELSGGPRVVDGQVYARWNPKRAVSIDAVYNAFSSYRYQNTEGLDPRIQRFANRAVGDPDVQLGEVNLLCLEPKVAHLVGGDVRVKGQGDGVNPFAKLTGRYRVGSRVVDPADPCQLDLINGYSRISPGVGLANLPVGGTLDLTLDGNLINVNGRVQSDVGLTVYFEPGEEGWFAIDTSYRMLFNKADPATNPLGYAGTGHYLDLFVDLVVVPADLTVGVGANMEVEPTQVEQVGGPVTFGEAGYGGYLRLTKLIRGAKK